MASSSTHHEHITGNRGTLRPAAFTLVELLVVIGIIALLISIVMPSLNSARVMARNTRTQALIKTVGDGVEMFYSDRVIGGQYPPSRWECDVAANTPGTLDDAPGFIAYGAETLVWALAGPDLIGPAGFEIGNMNNLYTDTSPRRTPFLDTSKASISDLGDAVSTVAEDDAAAATRHAFMILDTNHRPILYYRANAGAADPTAIYTYTDNYGVLGANGHDGDPLYDQGDWVADPPDGFEGFIHDPRLPVTVPPRPHNATSFILISPGEDNQYGTGDDIANFPVPQTD